MERLSCRVLPQRDPIYPSMNGLWVYKLSYIWKVDEEPWIFCPDDYQSFAHHLLMKQCFDWLSTSTLRTTQTMVHYHKYQFLQTLITVIPALPLIVITVSNLPLASAILEFHYHRGNGGSIYLVFNYSKFWSYWIDGQIIPYTSHSWSMVRIWIFNVIR